MARTVDKMPKQFKTDQVKKYYRILSDVEDAIIRYGECIFCDRKTRHEDVEIHSSGYSEIVGKPPQTKSQLKITHERGCPGQKYLKHLNRIRQVYGR